MSCQFNSKVKFISDVAAVFLYYLDDRYLYFYVLLIYFIFLNISSYVRHGNVLSGLPNIEDRFVVINFGGGFFSCGELRIKNSKVAVIKEESFQVGGEMLVGHMMGIVTSKGTQY